MKSDTAGNEMQILCKRAVEGRLMWIVDPAAIWGTLVMHCRSLVGKLININENTGSDEKNEGVPGKVRLENTSY